MKRPHCYLPVGYQSPEIVNAVAQAMMDAYDKGAEDMQAIIETMYRNSGREALDVIRNAPKPKKLHSHIKR